MIHFRLITAFLSFLLFSISAHAQDDYIMYNKQILRCEQQFLYLDNIKEGLKGYKKVFQKYSRPYAKDCFVALQLACLVGDTQEVEYFARLAFRRGVNWTGITYSQIINKFLNSNGHFHQKIKSIYDVEHLKFMESLNNEVRKIIIRMAHTDDSVKWSLNGMKGSEFTKQNKAYQELLDSNAVRIAKLTAQYGYLGFNKIGFADFPVKNHEEVHPKTCFLLVPIIDQLYYHHACCYFKNPEKLREALQAGEITPATYASIYEWAFLDLKEKRPEIRLCQPALVQTEYYNICPVMRFWQKNSDSILVNKCRSAIGLASTAHFNKRKAFEKETGVKLLFGHFEID